MSLSIEEDVCLKLENKQFSKLLKKQCKKMKLLHRNYWFFFQGSEYLSFIESEIMFNSIWICLKRKKLKSDIDITSKTKSRTSKEKKTDRRM